MEEWRGYSYHISVFLLLREQSLEQHKDAHNHRPALPSLTQTNKLSTFLLQAISSIFSQQTRSFYKHLAFIFQKDSNKNTVVHFSKGVSKTCPYIQEGFQNCFEKNLIGLFAPRKGKLSANWFPKGTAIHQQTAFVALTLLHPIIAANYICQLVMCWCHLDVTAKAIKIY